MYFGIWNLLQIKVKIIFTFIHTWMWLISFLKESINLAVNVTEMPLNLPENKCWPKSHLTELCALPEVYKNSLRAPAGHSPVPVNLVRAIRQLFVPCLMSVWCLSTLGTPRDNQSPNDDKVCLSDIATPKVNKQTFHVARKRLISSLFESRPNDY